jgi:uncharacterized protein YjbJ (UPF0337 family)
MNWDQIKGRWKELRGHARSEWGKLTDDDLDLVAGKRDVLLGRLQSRYGLAKDRAEHAIDEWLAKLEVAPQLGAHDEHLPRQRPNETR